MQRDVLLVGSVRLTNAEEVFRTVASVLGEHVKQVPDGETGWARSVWIQCQRPFFMANAALEMVESDPANPGTYTPARVPAGGIYGHTMSETYRGRARLRSARSKTHASTNDWTAVMADRSSIITDPGDGPASAALRPLAMISP